MGAVSDRAWGETLMAHARMIKARDEALARDPGCNPENDGEVFRARRAFRKAEAAWREAVRRERDQAVDALDWALS